MVLHTWTRELRFHPHVHALVTAGGLANDGARWVHSSKKYLFPVEVMGTLLRGKMMAALRRLHREGRFSTFADFADPEAFDRLMQKLAKKSWVVYAKTPADQQRRAESSAVEQRVAGEVLRSELTNGAFCPRRALRCGRASASLVTPA